MKKDAITKGFGNTQQVYRWVGDGSDSFKQAGPKVDTTGLLVLRRVYDGVVVPVPEPGSFALVLPALALVGWAARTRRRVNT